jgi:hypothetical protein
MIMNATFTGDTGYKRVYILDKDNGWQYTDAKYSTHGAVSILKDAVDYYLQFRPKEHYPIGTYVFVPDDVSDEIGFEEDSPVNPFKDKGFDMGKLWMIVDRDDSTQFVRYNILKCNWNFRWMVKFHGEWKLFNVYGSLRSASSYTSGVWRSDLSSQLDNITNAWIPDLYHVYGDKLSEYEFYDPRYMMHNQRFILSNNAIDPKVYEITKVLDINPQGIIKLTLKQDELDLNRDNLELMVCNYYDDTGETQIVIPEAEPQDDRLTSYIFPAHINENGELEIDLVQREERDADYTSLQIGKVYYYKVEYWVGTVGGEQVVDDTKITEWKINLYDTEGLTDAEIKHLDNLMVMEILDKDIVSINPKKAKSLIGHKFALTATDLTGESRSDIILEVVG